jgi:hypothetical protein
MGQDIGDPRVIGGRPAQLVLVRPKANDLAAIAELMTNGHIRSIVEHTYALENAGEALQQSRSRPPAQNSSSICADISRPLPAAVPNTTTEARHPAHYDDLPVTTVTTNTPHRFQHP